MGRKAPGALSRIPPGNGSFSDRGPPDHALPPADLQMRSPPHQEPALLSGRPPLRPELKKRRDAESGARRKHIKKPRRKFAGTEKKTLTFFAPSIILKKILHQDFHWRLHQRRRKPWNPGRPSLRQGAARHFSQENKTISRTKNHGGER